MLAFDQLLAKCVENLLGRTDVFHLAIDDVKDGVVASGKGGARWLIENGVLRHGRNDCILQQIGQAVGGAFGVS